MKNVPTHTGVLHGADTRTPRGARQRVKLRRTAKYWITEHGTRYRSANGWGTGDWPMWFLDLKSIKELEKDS